MTTPVALQLYTVRDALARDFEGVVRHVASIGYAGVETAGFPGTTPAAASALFRSLGLKVPSAHLPLPLGDKKREVLDTAGALGCRYIVAPYVAPEEYGTLDGVRRVCERFNEANRAAKEAGFVFAIHNHWWEFEPVGDRPAYQTMLELLEPDVIWEVDTYWVQTAGLDPATVVRELGERAPLLHIKDGPATKEAAMVAVGEGVIDFPAILEAGGDHSSWLIVELDRCDTDMMEAVEKSYEYLVRNGLGRGKDA